MTEFRMRVDHVTDFSMLDLDRYLGKYATRYLLVRHEPKQTDIHYHIWLETTYAEVTIRLMLTKLMPYLKGNGGHSIQACLADRRDEYWQYLFNRKHGNLASYVKDVGVPNWEHYQELANVATVEYLKTKKAYSKNDCIEELLATPKEWDDEGKLFDVVMKLTRQRKVVFSINAIRDIIIAVGYHNGTQHVKHLMKDAVLKVFYPYVPPQR